MPPAVPKPPMNSETTGAPKGFSSGSPSENSGTTTFWTFLYSFYLGMGASRGFFFLGTHSTE
jgi:hypothetical protein